MSLNSLFLAGSSSSSSCQIPFPAQTTLEYCAARVNAIIKKVEFSIQNKCVNAIYCPISLEFPSDPVGTKCKHIFEKSELDLWYKQDEACPVCRTLITKVFRIDNLGELIELGVSKELRLSCLDFIDLDKEKQEISPLSKYNHPEVDSIVAQNRPSVEESDKALFRQLHLGLSLIRQGKTEEALKTLITPKRKDLGLAAVIVALALEASASLENITWGLKIASKQKDLSDKIFIYQQIIAHAPNSLEAYENIFPLIKDLHFTEKKNLFSKAADLASQAGLAELEESFRLEAEKSIVPRVISAKEWANAGILHLPPYPQDLQEFLSQDCTIWPEKKRWETHIVVPFFPQAAIGDEAPVDLTLASLERLHQSAGGLGFREVWHDLLWEISAEKEFYYAVMTKDPIPESRKMTHVCQLQLLAQKGYQAPPVLGAALAIFWENRRTGERLFGYYPINYTRCREMIGKYSLIIGGFTSEGLRIGEYHKNHEHLTTGMAGWREFRGR